MNYISRPVQKSLQQEGMELVLLMHDSDIEYLKIWHLKP